MRNNTYHVIGLSIIFIIVIAFCVGLWFLFDTKPSQRVTLRIELPMTSVTEADRIEQCKLLMAQADEMGLIGEDEFNCE